MSDVTIESLMADVMAAEQRHEDLKARESEVRRNATAAENDLSAARKAFADFMVKKHPKVADEIAERRRNRA